MLTLQTPRLCEGGDAAAGSLRRGRGMPWEDPSHSTPRCHPAHRTRRRRAATMRRGTGVTPTLLLRQTAAPSSQGIPCKRRSSPRCLTGTDRKDLLLRAVQQRAFGVSLNSELQIGRILPTLKTWSPLPSPRKSTISNAFPVGRHRLQKSLMDKLEQHAYGCMHLYPYPEGWKHT